MFHTFETARSITSPDPNEANGSASKRRIPTTRACEPCRKRKIRCNGERPCEACDFYRNAHTCHYTESRQRQTPSLNSEKKISATLQKYRGILQKLYPTVHPDLLADLSREKLIEMIPKNSPTEFLSPMTPALNDKPPLFDPDAGSLEFLQPMAEDLNEGTEHRSRGVTGIADDVNALSLSIKESPSYLGISSVIAVLRAMVWLDPDSQTFFSRTGDHSGIASREQSSPPDGIGHDQIARTQGSSSIWDEIPLINAYFTFVHPIIPLIEEQSFRDTYMQGKRSDSRWLLVLNTVLAMGSIAAGSADDRDHHVYFNRAKQYLPLEDLGSPHLERVQAFAILGGLYLHYVQQPNLANALMGATFRMATTLGLHREYLDGVVMTTPKDMAYSVEMRRRVWWCLFNLDAWAGSTLGRPSMGRIGQAITAKIPQQPITQSPQLLVLLQDNIRFCTISTRMEDALAVSPIVPEADLVALDTSFTEWFKTSSAQIKTPGPHPQEMPGVTVAKNVMRWRYLFSRAILHRPYLLWYAMQRMEFSALTPAKKVAIELCRDVSEEVINDISSTWRAQKPCGMAAWNATWLLYQAVMVPLLSLYSDPQDRSVVERSRNQIEVAMITLADTKGWSPTATRSLEVVSRIYEASKRLSSPDDDSAIAVSAASAASLTEFQANMLGFSLNNDITRTPRALPLQTNLDFQELFIDNMFDSLNWSTGLNDLDYPFEMPSM